MAYKIPTPKEHSPLAEQMRRMSSEQLYVAMGQVHTIQLTYGCSVRCYFCGCNVPKGLKESIPVEIVDFFAENFQQQLSLREAYLSGNNDPLDWESRGKDFMYAWDRLTDYDSWNSGACTAVPPGKEELALKCVEQRYVIRLSVSTMNKKRLKRKVPQIFRAAREKGVDVYYPEKNLIQMGRNSEGEYGADNLSNRVGTMITPLGISNINLTHPSARFQTGEIETLVDPDNFKVIEWGRRKALPTEIWDYWIYGRNGAFPVHILGEEDTEVVDPNIANIDLFFSLFYGIKRPKGREMQDDYLDAGRKAIRRIIPQGDLTNIEPTNDASAQRLEKVIDSVPRVIRGLKKKDDFWSRRKRVLLEDNLVLA
jgi:hypothetical protein